MITDRAIIELLESMWLGDARSCIWLINSDWVSGEGGSAASGGQIRKIALARAFAFIPEY